MRYILLLILLLNYTAVFADELIFVGDNFCPYSCIDEELPGIVCEITREIFESKGHRVIIKILPYSRAKKNIQNYTGIMGIAPLEDSELYYPKEFVAILKPCFYVKKGSTWRFKNYQSLNSLKIGLVQDYEYEVLGREFSEFMRKNKDLIQYAVGRDAHINNYNKLVHNRIETTIAGKHMTGYYLYKLNMTDKIIEAGCFDVEVPLYVAFSTYNKNAEKFAKIFDQGIKELITSGKLKKILLKYGIRDWQ